MENHIALDAIRKKLVGKHLTYEEIYAIMDEIAHDRLGDVLTTYFVASGYSQGFSNEEIYHLTKAMVETGEKLSFKGIIADKHSIGGVPGGRVTMIVVPIIAAAGYTIPKSSSRAITTPAGTADAMETIAEVSFTEKEIYKIVKKTNACIVWGGSVKIAPADDEIIQIEEPLLFESFDKVLVSVMAKKIAFGSSHIVIDLPYGKHVKLHSKNDAEILKKKFQFIAHRFKLKLSVVMRKVHAPPGNGVGPLLEARDALKVLEQTDDRPTRLEETALAFASDLLSLCLKDSPKKTQDKIKKQYKTTYDWAKDILTTKQAHNKMKEIISAQKGKASIKSSDLKPARYKGVVKSAKSGKVTDIDSKHITIIARILGTPESKTSGLYLEKRIRDSVKKNEAVCTFYSTSKEKIKEAINSLDQFPIFTISSNSK